MTTCHRSRESRSPLPRNWPRSVRSAVLHAIALAQFAIVYTRSWAAEQHQRPGAAGRRERPAARRKSPCSGRRSASRTPAWRRSRRTAGRSIRPRERMAILELKAARGWSLEQTAKAFLVTAATIASWMKRLDEEGPDALVQLRQPVNKFPEFVRYVVQRLKTLCPAMGKVKIAQTLARAGLHLGATTVGRMLKEKRRCPTQPPTDAETGARPATRRHGQVRPTTSGTSISRSCRPAGLLGPWLPFSLPQCWPFCWWVAVVVDHFSRRAMGVTAFKSQPTSEAVRSFLGPSDRQGQEDAQVHRLRPRQAVRLRRLPGLVPPQGHQAAALRGHRQTRSIAVVERFILTMKMPARRACCWFPTDAKLPARA